MSKFIQREIDVNAPPAQVYEALLDAKIFAAITGAPTEIDPRPGGVFANFGGVITGRNIELVAPSTIVQAWRVKFWPAFEYSIVRFDLKPQGAGTRLTLEHKGFPDEVRSHLNGELPEGGWDRQYLDRLKQHFS